MNELQKSMTKFEREKVNTQEPPSIVPLAINVQPLFQMIEDISNKVNVVSKIDIL